EADKDHATSITFMDDAESNVDAGEEQGLYGYLLTILDRLESESAVRVCVMMPAMNVAHLPPALVRSGRVELWLGMKLPDPQARTEILSDHLQSLPTELREVDVPQLIAATEGFTGADLKRTVEDGKAIYAYDKAKRVKLRPTSEYFMRAVEAVKENKERYAEAEAQAALRPKSPLSGFMRSFISSQVIRGDEDE